MKWIVALICASSFLGTYQEEVFAGDTIIQEKEEAAERKSPKDVDEFFVMIDDVIPPETNPNTDDQVDLGKKMNEFLELNPTTQQVARFLEMRPALEDHFVKRTEDMIRSAITDKRITSAKKYLTFVRESKYIADKGVLATVEDFIKLRPTIGQVNEYTRKYANTDDVDLYMKLKRYAFTKTFRETKNWSGQAGLATRVGFFDLIDYAMPSGRTPSNDYQVALRDLIKEHMGLFLDLKPSREELDSLLSRHPDVGKIESADYYLTYAFGTKRLVDTDITTMAEEFIKLRPTVKEINKFLIRQDICGTEQDMKYTRHTKWETKHYNASMKLKRYAFANKFPADVNGFWELNDHPYFVCGEFPKDYQEGLCELVKEHIEQFLKLNPTADDINRLIYTFPEIEEQLSIFKNPLSLQLIDGLDEKITSMGKDAYEKLEKSCREQHDRIERFHGEKRMYLEDVINRKKVFGKNEIERTVQDAHRRVSTIDLKNQKGVLFHFIGSLRESLDQAVRRADAGISQSFETALYHKKRLMRTTWSLPTRFATPVGVDFLNQSLARQNEGVLPEATGSDPAKKCGVCLEDMEEDKRVTTTTCCHQLCVGCFTTYLEGKMMEGPFPIRCFTMGCRAVLVEDDIKKVFTETELARWKKQTLLKKQEVISCPGNECNHCLSLPNNQDYFLCCKCFQEICPKCSGPAHKGIVACNKVKSEVAKVRGKVGDKGYNRLRWKGIVQKCPGCKAPTIRSKACKHIDCTICGRRWNYKWWYRSDLDRSIN